MAAFLCAGRFDGYVGTKKLVKRKEFEQFISSKLMI